MHQIPTATDNQIISLLAGYPVDLSVRETDDPAEIAEVCGEEPNRKFPDFLDVVAAVEEHECVIFEIMGLA